MYPAGAGPLWRKVFVLVHCIAPLSTRPRIIRDVCNMNETFPEKTFPVAVVIPCYNYGRFLGECLDSVLAQTVRPSEILVVDDGSTDNTAEVAEQYAPSVRYMYKHNGGLASTRNFGIRHTTSKWVMFPDADDILMHTALQALLSAAAVAPEAVVVFADAYEFGEGRAEKYGFVESKGIKQDAEQQVDVGVYLLGKERFWLRLVKGSPIPHCAAIVRREALVAVGGYDEELGTWDDHDLWLRMCLSGRVAWTGTTIAGIRRHSGQLTSPENTLNRKPDSERVHRKQLNNRDLTRRQRKAVKSAYGNHLWDWGYGLFALEGYRDARVKFRQAIAANPFRLKNWIYYVITLCPGLLVKRLRRLKQKLTGGEHPNLPQ